MAVGFRYCASSLIFAKLSRILCNGIGVLNQLLYIAGMNLLKLVICLLLVLGLSGCAVSRNPNPVIRYGANTGASMALPGVAVLCVAGALDDDDSSEDMAKLGLLGLGAAGIGYAVGAVLGGTVGFFKWMFNGFENDDIPQVEPLPEELLPPARNDEYGSKLR